MLPFLLGSHMLHPHLLDMLLHELPNIPRIPQLRRNTQVLTTPHQRIALAALRRSRNAIWGEVLLLATRNRHQPAAAHEAVLACHYLAGDDGLAARCQTPTSGPESAVEDASILDLGEVEDAVGFYFYVVERDLLL